MGTEVADVSCDMIGVNAASICLVSARAGMVRDPTTKIVNAREERIRINNLPYIFKNQGRTCDSDLDYDTVLLTGHLYGAPTEGVSGGPPGKTRHQA